jgi:hypothetical protein
MKTLAKNYQVKVLFLSKNKHEKVSFIISRSKEKCRYIGYRRQGSKLYMNAVIDPDR